MTQFRRKRGKRVAKIVPQRGTEVLTQVQSSQIEVQELTGIHPQVISALTAYDQIKQKRRKEEEKIEGIGKLVAVGPKFTDFPNMNIAAALWARKDKKIQGVKVAIPTIPTIPTPERCHSATLETVETVAPVETVETPPIISIPSLNINIINKQEGISIVEGIKENIDYPWTAKQKMVDVGRVELVNGLFPLTKIAPIWEYTIVDKNGKKLILDKTQLGAVNMILSGGSMCLIGAAGTGKSTILQAALELLAEHLSYDVSYRIVRGGGERELGASAALIAFTNKAKNVIASKLQDSSLLRSYGFGANVTTGHNLLEYTKIVEWNEDKGKDTVRFVETRGKDNPLNISHLCIDEAGNMGVGTETANQLGNKLLDALLPEDSSTTPIRPGVQLILIGDINQLPPVGGKSILSYGLNSLPVTELTTIHRQALDSPIIAQAWNVLKGKEIKEQVNLKTESVFTIKTPRMKEEIRTGKVVKMGAEAFNAQLVKNLPILAKKGHFIPGEDIILCPFNKPHSEGKKGKPITYVSTHHINSLLGTYFARERKAEVWEISAGYNRLFLSIGDVVMVNKNEGRVTEIRKNTQYVGRVVREPSEYLTYFGYIDRSVNINLQELEKREIDREKEGKDAEYDYSELDLDAIIDGDKEIGRQASARVTVELDSGEVVTLAQSGEFAPNSFQLAYAISVHKAQGSEWRNVFVVLHDCHSTMMSRELLYTAITRPREKCIIIAQKHVIQKCIDNPRIKGDSLKKKIEFFNEGGYLTAGSDFSFKKLRLLQPIDET